MPTIAEVLATAQLPGDEARRDAQLLLCRALDKPRTYLLAWPEAPVPENSLRKFAAWLQRRREGEPIAYILGEREFWSLTLKVTPATLIPRADTERLVEVALSRSLPGNAQVLDLGTGSGAIALALASERPHWQITAVDVSDAALQVARSNGQRLALPRIRWLQGSWFEPVGAGQFHLIASNPPYIADDDPHLQGGDLPREPRAALVAADNGLEDLRQLVNAAPEHLFAGGVLLLEHGYEQAAAVREMLLARGFEQVQSWHDLGGHERVSGGAWNAGGATCP